jgi:transcriptional regulator GlxA family with amidase domain
MAATVGMSARHFARVFQKQLGKPPATFVREARLDAARRALEVSDHGLAQVAADTGFGTEETLRRVFHQSLAVTPAAYRQRFRRGGQA